MNPQYENPKDTKAVNDDPELALYFPKLVTHRILRPEEELELGKKINEGKEYPFNAHIVATAEEAKKTLANHNYRLVLNIARTYTQTGRFLSIEDLFQEGSIGLLAAIERFDYTRGFKFSTYASFWIRQAIGRTISNKNNLVRIPVHAQESIRQLDKVSAQLQQNLHREPTIQELASQSGLKEERVEELLILKDFLSTVSLDAPLLSSSENNKATGLDYLPDDTAEQAIQDIFDQVDRDIIFNAISALPTKLRSLVEFMYGPNRGSIPEYARLTKQTTGNVRYMHGRALKLLRKSLKNFQKNEATSAEEYLKEYEKTAKKPLNTPPPQISLDLEKKGFDGLTVATAYKKPQDTTNAEKNTPENIDPTQSPLDLFYKEIGPYLAAVVELWPENFVKHPEYKIGVVRNTFTKKLMELQCVPTKEQLDVGFDKAVDALAIQAEKASLIAIGRIRLLRRKAEHLSNFDRRYFTIARSCRDIRNARLE